jgi:hypothetical protein
MDKVTTNSVIHKNVSDIKHPLDDKIADALIFINHYNSDDDLNDLIPLNLHPSQVLFIFKILCNCDAKEFSTVIASALDRIVFAYGSNHTEKDKDAFLMIHRLTKYLQILI